MGDPKKRTFSRILLAMGFAATITIGTVGAQAAPKTVENPEWESPLAGVSAAEAGDTVDKAWPLPPPQLKAIEILPITAGEVPAEPGTTALTTPPSNANSNP
jgi:hypothetical protein